MEASLIRTQIQLREEQAGSLRRLAAQRNRSVADLIREGVDLVLEGERSGTTAERMRRAARAFGRSRSGTADLSTRHDEYFAGVAGRK